MGTGNTKSYKLRKSGNSTILTVPPKIRKLLNVVEGDELEFIEVGKQVRLQKATPVSARDTLIQHSINQLILK